MGVHAVVRVAVALGLFASALWGVKQIDPETVARYFPNENLSMLKDIGKSQSPCKGAKERCISTEGAMVFEGECRMLWHKCGQIVEKRRGWADCKMAETKCMKDKEKVLDGRCGMVWKKCGGVAHGHKKPADDLSVCKAAETRCMKNGEKRLDGKCGLVWEQCGKEMKAHEQQSDAWWACNSAKQKCTQDSEERMHGNCGIVWEKCVEEVKKHAGEKKKVDKKDCYFDEACHKLVDWKKIGEMKKGFFPRVQMAHGDKAKLKELMKHVHENFKKAGMPEDRIDYILEKWAKFAATKDEKREAFDGWWACKAAKTSCLKAGGKVFDGKCSDLWEKCGEEVKESSSKKKEVDMKDCYFDEACHKLVDWKKIGKVKQDVLARMKMVHGDKAKRDKLTKAVHEIFNEAGMPGDRIDYILEKWTKSVSVDIALEDAASLAKSVAKYNQDTKKPEA